jgi:hypothetical protein
MTTVAMAQVGASATKTEHGVTSLQASPIAGSQDAVGLPANYRELLKDFKPLQLPPEPLMTTI